MHMDIILSKIKFTVLYFITYRYSYYEEDIVHSIMGNAHLYPIMVSHALSIMGNPHLYPIMVSHALSIMVSHVFKMPV